MIEVRHRRNNLPQLIIAVAVIFALVVLRRSPGGLLVVAGLLGPSAIPALMIFVAVVAAASIYAKLRGRPF